MAQMVLATESAQVRNMKAINDRYISYSEIEIAAYQAENYINGKYLHEITGNEIKEQCELKLQSILNKNVEVIIVDDIELMGKLQLKTKYDNDNLIVNIVGIALIPEIITEDENGEALDEPITYYLIDCSLCEIERAVHYD